MSFEATTKYLTDPKWPLEEISKFEYAVGLSPVSQFVQKPYLDLFSHAKNTARSNAILLSRLLDLYLITGPPLPSELVSFEPDSSIDDPFYPITVLSFYTRWVQRSDSSTNQYLWDSVAPAIEKWMNKFNDDTDEDRDLYISELVNLNAAVSFAQPAYAQDQATKHGWFAPNFLDPTSVDYHILFLSKFNPDAIPEDPGYQTLDLLLLYTKRYFPILLNMILSPKTFELLKSSLLSQKLSRLSYDFLYQFLAQSTRYAYSADYLLNLLPTMVSDYLVSLPSAINDPEIWNLKKEALHNLLLHSDLGMWEDKVTSTYKVMVNGKNIKDIEPAVDIMDETA
jgi:hypothetical protein